MEHVALLILKVVEVMLEDIQHCNIGMKELLIRLMQQLNGHVENLQQFTGQVELDIKEDMHTVFAKSLKGVLLRYHNFFEKSSRPLKKNLHR